MAEHRIYSMPVAEVYPHYVNKVERKGRTEDELIEVITWLTGYNAATLSAALERRDDFRTFFDNAPGLHPRRELITGSICGVKVQEIEDPLMYNIRCMDKLVDEIAKGRPMEKILR